MSAVLGNPYSNDAMGAKDKLPVELAKLSKRLHRQLGQAIADFNMIEPGDKVMVCVSGGKDSHALLDLLQTLLMNMFFGAKLKGMPAKLVSDDGRHVVIRPLAYANERDLERWAAHRRFPIIPCTLCGSQDNLQRVQMRQMLRDWEQRF